jgi:hypothetical protein
MQILILYKIYSLGTLHLADWYECTIVWGAFPIFPEDRGSKLLLKVCTCMKIYMTSYSRRPNSSEHRCENLKFDNACSSYQTTTFDRRSRRDVANKIALIRGTLSAFFFNNNKKKKSHLLKIFEVIIGLR